jgi:hypothetical protein
MVKQQSLSQMCICGQKMSFPEGQVKAGCPTKGCQAEWECGPEGFWSIKNITAPLVPILAKPASSAKPSKEKAKYNNRPKSRRRGR